MRATTFDVLVIGGGVVGAGAALDAVTRGLSVALVEQRDWASGSSSRSSRLAHGGLRYLEQLKFGLVHEALRERGLLLDTIAPHLTRPVQFVLPLTRAWERPYAGAGVALYDVLSRMSRAGGQLPRHRHLSASATTDLAPGLKPTAHRGAITFWDAQIDDRGHTMALVRTAAAYGAAVASNVEVVGFLRDGDRVVGAQGVDVGSGQPLAIRASVVISATGVWTEHTRSLLDGSAGPAPTVTPSKGIHLILPGSAIDLRTAVIARTSASVLFLLPWEDTWIVGTTDSPWTGDLAEPTVESEEVDYLLAQANRWLVRPLGREQVIDTYAGLRPLVTSKSTRLGRSTETSKLSREHAVYHPVRGLVQVAGGKFTTYRVMAADAVDEAARDLEVSVGRTRTRDITVISLSRVT